jgi:hypothetical protein
MDNKSANKKKKDYDSSRIRSSDLPSSISEEEEKNPLEDSDGLNNPERRTSPLNDDITTQVLATIIISISSEEPPTRMIECVEFQVRGSLHQHGLLPVDFEIN